MGDSASGFSKPSRNRGNLRKRNVEEEVEDDSAFALEDLEGMRKAKIQKKTPLTFSTKDEAKNKSVKILYESDRKLQQASDQGATREVETETAKDNDARALRERVLAQAGAGPSDDGTYKGINNYIDHKKGFRREHTIGAEKGGGSHGPLRAPSNIRMTVRFDYQPDICKDYKETGFCGYGDACKFIHDRGDYKSGWELEREWNERQKRVEDAKWGDDEEEEAEEEEDELPFACYLCRKPWAEIRDPVVTRCKHYFCETCALRHNSLNKGKCAICEQPTNGIFNVANDIVKKVKVQKKKDDEGN